MLKSLLMALTAMAALAGATAPAFSTIEQGFYCQGDDRIFVFSTPFGGMVNLEVNRMGESALEATGLLTAQPSGEEGVTLYSDGTFTLSEREGDFTIRRGGSDPYPCERIPEGESPATARFEADVTPNIAAMAAQSWGGNVRSGPGTEHEVIASLAEGDAVTVLEDTGIEFNGYAWFAVELPDGRQGYHWGGIICGVDAEIPGTFQTCDAAL